CDRRGARCLAPQVLRSRPDWVRGRATELLRIWHLPLNYHRRSWIIKPTIIVRVLGIVSVVALSLPLNAQQPTIPPTINSVWPKGLARGATATFTVEGRNLTAAKVLFDSPGINGKVLSVTDLPDAQRVARPGVDFGAIVPQGAKQEAKIEVAAAKDVEPGIHWFRVETSLGTSNMVV